MTDGILRFFAKELLMVTDRADPTKATEPFFLLMYVRGGDRVVMECSYVVMHPIRNRHFMP